MTENTVGNPFDNSAEASMKRFEARQQFNKSAEGMIVAVQRKFEAEDRLATAEEANQEPKPTHVSIVEFLGLQVAKIKEWARK